jgi:hypothetical protein
MATVRHYQRIIDEAYKKLHAIENENSKKNLKKLVGKCFKYKNSYSSPEKESDYWYLYRKVLRIADEHPFIVSFDFQTDKDGKISIEPEERSSTHLPGMVEIDGVEFWQEWCEVLKKVQKINVF